MSKGCTQIFIDRWSGQTNHGTPLKGKVLGNEKKLTAHTWHSVDESQAKIMLSGQSTALPATLPKKKKKKESILWFHFYEILRNANYVQWQKADLVLPGKGGGEGQEARVTEGRLLGVMGMDTFYVVMTYKYEHVRTDQTIHTCSLFYVNYTSMMLFLKILSNW